MKRILYVRENAPGGIDNYCRRLEVLFKNDTLLEPMPVSDIPVRKSLFFHYYYRQRALAQEIKKADIVHINGYTAMGTVQALWTAKHYGKRVVYTAHWHPFQYLGHPLLGRIFFKVFMKEAILRCADVVTAINAEDEAFFHSFFPNVARIPHWLEVCSQDVNQRKRPDMILFVGRLDDHVKGVDMLLSLPEGKYDIHCVGHGERPFCRKDTTFHTNLSDKELNQLYYEASLVVVPSKYEAFSYVALEALLHGTPVVMSDRVRIADYLCSEDCVATFKYRDGESFCRQVDRMIGRKVDVEKIKSIFSADKARTQYRCVYLGKTFNE